LIQLLVCDLGFSSAKWIYGERKGRIISTFSYNGDVIRDIQGELQAHVGMHADFDRVLLFGGGAALLKNGLPARNIEVIVLPEPEFANARCFQTLAFATTGFEPVTSILERLNS